MTAGAVPIVHACPRCGETRVIRFDYAGYSYIQCSACKAVGLTIVWPQLLSPEDAQYPEAQP